MCVLTRPRPNILWSQRGIRLPCTSQTANQGATVENYTKQEKNLVMGEGLEGGGRLGFWARKMNSDQGPCRAGIRKNGSRGGLETTQSVRSNSMQTWRKTPSATRNNVTALFAPAEPEDRLLSSQMPQRRGKKTAFMTH